VIFKIILIWDNLKGHSIWSKTDYQILCVELAKNYKDSIILNYYIIIKDNLLLEWALIVICIHYESTNRAFIIDCIPAEHKNDRSNNSVLEHVINKNFIFSENTNWTLIINGIANISTLSLPAAWS